MFHKSVLRDCIRVRFFFSSLALHVSQRVSSFVPSPHILIPTLLHVDIFLPFDLLVLPLLQGHSDCACHLRFCRVLVLLVSLLKVSASIDVIGHILLLKRLYLFAFLIANFAFRTNCLYIRFFTTWAYLLFSRNTYFCRGEVDSGLRQPTAFGVLGEDHKGPNPCHDFWFEHFDSNSIFQIRIVCLCRFWNIRTRIEWSRRHMSFIDLCDLSQRWNHGEICGSAKWIEMPELCGVMRRVAKVDPFQVLEDRGRRADANTGEGHDRCPWKGRMQRWGWGWSLWVRLFVKTRRFGERFASFVLGSRWMWYSTDALVSTPWKCEMDPAVFWGDEAVQWGNLPRRLCLGFVLLSLAPRCEHSAQLVFSHHAAHAAHAYSRCRRPLWGEFTDWTDWDECSKTCRALAAPICGTAYNREVSWNILEYSCNLGIQRPHESLRVSLPGSVLNGARQERTREIETEAAHGGLVPWHLALHLVWSGCHVVAWWRPE